MKHQTVAFEFAEEAAWSSASYKWWRVQQYSRCWSVLHPSNKLTNWPDNSELKQQYRISMKKQSLQSFDKSQPVCGSLQQTNPTANNNQNLSTATSFHSIITVAETRHCWFPFWHFVRSKEYKTSWVLWILYVPTTWWCSTSEHSYRNLWQTI